MLKLLLGTAGSGKTTQLHQRVGEAARAGRAALVLVPEQYSFETEKALCQELGPRLSNQVEVLSFTRLCNQIFRAYGGLAGDYIDDCARLLLMSQTLYELEDRLEVYASRMHSGSFIQAMVGQVSEFKNAGVTPEELAQFAQHEPEDSLRGKTEELSLIFSVYQAMIDRGYKDAEDDLTRACGFLEYERFFTGYDVFVDSFKTFTAGERMLLEHIVAQADQVTLALCTDQVEDADSGMGLFSPIKRTAARLLRFAKEQGIPAEEEPAPSNHPRFLTPDLAHLEQHLFREQPAAYVAPCPAVRLVSAKNQYDEVEYVAAQIQEAVRAGIRYRDIVVIGRDLSAYQQAFESLFSRYEIPYFLDSRSDVESKPLTAALLHAVGAVKIKTGFDTDELLALLKTSLLGVSAQTIGELENYCFVWDIKGPAWLQPFTANPAGFGTRTEADDAACARIEALRIQLAGSLLPLQEAIHDCDGVGFARALYRFLEQSGILSVLRDGTESGALAAELVDDCAPLYDIVVNLLEQFSTALEGVRLPPARFAELLRLAFGVVDLGELPQTLDQVIVGSADRIRVAAPRIAFLVGVNDGVFPMPCPSGGIFSDTERERLIEFGLEIADTSQSRSLEEQFNAYMALCSASEQLIICRSRTTIQGTILYPSTIIKSVRAVLPLVEELDARTDTLLDYAQSPQTAFDLFCRRLRVDDPLTATLAAFLREQGQAERVERLLHPAAAASYRLRDPVILRRLYGGDIAVSPSRLDKFHACKLAHFCQYDLRLRARRRAELSPLESGSVVHFVLQAMLSNHPVEDFVTLSDQALHAEIRALLEQYIEEEMGGIADKSARFFYLFSRLESTLVRLVRHLGQEFAASDFRPVFFELPIRRARADDSPNAPRVEPLELELPSGGHVRVEGIVDRVDRMTKNGVTYLRVVDYKTGSKEFSLSDVYYGMNLQMLVYLFTLRAVGPAGLEGATPAGILYMPAQTPFSLLDRSSPDEKAVQKQMDALRMSGLLLKNMDALEGMEHGCGGNFLPVSVKVKAPANSLPQATYKGPVATLAEFGQLERHVWHLVVEMAETLREGIVGAFPTFTKNNMSMCEYCEFHDICNREANDPHTEAEELGREAFFERLQQMD